MSCNKESKGKPQLQLIPYAALLEVTRAFEYGSSKYGEDNWRKGNLYRKYAGAALRHVWSWLWGSDIDPESDVNHLAHAAANLMMLITWQDEGKGTDDRYRDAS